MVFEIKLGKEIEREIKMEEIQKTKEDIKEEREKNRKQKDIKLEIILFVIFALILGGTLCLKYIIKYQKEHYTNSVNNYYNYDYKYVLDYFLGADYFIYLLQDDTVKVVSKTPIFEECKEQNCFLDTGNFEYKENTITFSEEVMVRVKEVITSFFKDNSRNEIDLRELELTSEQIRIMDGIILDSEELVMFDKYLKITEEKDEIKDKEENVIFTNVRSKILDSKYENIGKIGNYLNEIVEKNSKEYHDECQRMIDEGNSNIEDMCNSRLKLEIKYIGSSNVSFTYLKDGIYKGYELKGYTFNIGTGEIIPVYNGFKKEYYESAIKSFTNSEFYKTIEELLAENWKDILYENMFEIGNWYITEKKIIFLIPAYLLGLDNAVAQVIEIEIDNSKGEF